MSTEMIGGKNPYRTAAAIQVHKPQNTYGLIRAKAPTKPHKCSKPGWFVRLLYSLIGRTIHPGSMFRCSCGAFYMLRKDGYTKRVSWSMQGRSGAEEWVELGGKYEREN